MKEKEITIIVAMDKNGLIGKGNALPWSLPEDLRHFKKKTMGKFVIMGEKTYSSISSPLPGRKIIVLSKNKDLKIEGAKVANSIEEALINSTGEIMIAGGKSVYEQFLEKANKMYLTVINEELEGDVYFPEFNKDNWRIIEEERGNNPLITFQTLERIS